MFVRISLSKVTLFELVHGKLCDLQEINNFRRFHDYEHSLLLRGTDDDDDEKRTSIRDEYRPAYIHYVSQRDDGDFSGPIYIRPSNNFLLSGLPRTGNDGY